MTEFVVGHAQTEYYHLVSIVVAVGPFVVHLHDENFVRTESSGCDVSQFAGHVGYIYLAVLVAGLVNVDVVFVTVVTVLPIVVDDAQQTFFANFLATDVVVVPIFEMPKSVRAAAFAAEGLYGNLENVYVDDVECDLVDGVAE